MGMDAYLADAARDDVFHPGWYGLILHTERNDTAESLCQNCAVQNIHTSLIFTRCCLVSIRHRMISRQRRR